MKNILHAASTALCAMGVVLFSASLNAKSAPASGTLDSTFNPGGPKQGQVVKSMSPFLNIASGIGVQTIGGASSGNEYKIVIGGDAVQKANSHEPSGTGVPDGFVDERGWSLLRLRDDGSVDKSFGPNGNGRIYFQPGTLAATSAQPCIQIDSSQRIIYGGNNQLAASVSYGPPVDNRVPAGATGISAELDFIPAKDPVSGYFYGTTQIALARFTPNGTLDRNYGTSGKFLLPPIFGGNNPNGWGDKAKAILNDLSNQTLVAGVSFPDDLPSKGCIYGFPLLTRVTATGSLDTLFNSSGIVVEGSKTVDGVADTTNFTDQTGAAPVNLGFAQYEAIAFHNNGGPLQGFIVAAGDGDINYQNWPSDARIIVARYTPNGTLDTSFGVNGRLVISAASQAPIKQMLCRSIAIDADDNIYLGGDIANQGSGPPGETRTAFSTPANLHARTSASFLLIKLNSQGIPQNFGPAVCSSSCSSVFQSCRTCDLYWNNGTSTLSFRALTTHFGGYDDAIFALTIDNKNKSITAIGQASEHAALQSQHFALAQFSFKGGLNRSFGTFGLMMIDGGRNHRSVGRAFVLDPFNKLIVAGQSGLSHEEVTRTNFQDSTEKDFCVIRVNP